MRMARSETAGKGGASLLVALAAILSLWAAGCKGTTAPESTVGQITVTNSCGAKVDIFLDGASIASIDDGSYYTIDSVTPGARLLEVKKSDNGAVLLATTITVAANAVYSLTVEGNARLTVTNHYGEILSIYVDDGYLGDIGDGLTQTVNKVRFGVHNYEARKKSDGTVAATTTIDVEDTIEYTWVITP
jgi:hypothetical protein